MRKKDFFVPTRCDKGTIKGNSPFRIYYDRVLSREKLKLESKINNIADGEMIEVNEYFAPELFQLIRKKLYIMPLWSAVMVQDWCTLKKLTFPRYRETNNPVENYFDHLKVKLLAKNFNEIKWF